VYAYASIHILTLSYIHTGIAFFNERGERPAECSAWQFNFKFSLAKDMFAQDSIDLLKRSGIQFARHEKVVVVVVVVVVAAAVAVFFAVAVHSSCTGFG
jgi:hypothetical protein